MRRLKHLPAAGERALLWPPQRYLIAALAFGILTGAPTFAQTPRPVSVSQASFNVVTHHYDNARTGWNQQETVLSPSVVNPQSFGLLATVALDDQVNAQPLLVGLRHGARVRDVVYVVTENDTIYAIDAETGAILTTRNFGPPVPSSALPGQCGAGSTGHVGIDSTPVIDVSSETIYLISYTMENTQPVYRIHALDLNTLADKVASGVIVTASHTLSNGARYVFNAAVSRQRPALLEVNGNVYAGFGSFCDLEGNLSRGWLLGWHAQTLDPLPNNQLDDQLSTSSTGTFLTSIWMSGAGIAADEAGHLWFVTGNSNPSAYLPPQNIQESAVEVSGDLSQVLGLFTPSDQVQLDSSDGDLGSGGILIVPQQTSLPLPNLAYTVGKSGYVYLLNRNAFAGNSSPSKIAYSFLLGGCWCTSSYFMGSDGVGRIVNSVGYNVITYELKSTGAGVTLAYEYNSAVLNTGQDPGFFTTVSSNGTQTGTLIIWAVTRPIDSNPATVNLLAFDNIHGEPIYSGAAGSWPILNGNANIVPVVANGRVYVASNQQLAIFGLGGVTPTAAQMTTAAAPTADTGSQISGTVRSINGSLVTLETRSGLAPVDVSEAQAAHLSVIIIVGKAITARGTRDTNGLLLASTVIHAKSSPKLWPPDR